MENFDNFLDKNTTAIDSPIDEKAIYFGAVATDKVLLEDSVLLSDGEVLNQGATNWCVAVGTTDGVNNGSAVLGLKGNKDFITLVDYIRKNLDDKIDERGTWIKNGPIGARKLNWIKGFTYIKTQEEIKKSLTYGMSVNTGTNKLSWSATRKNNYIAVLGKGGGHDMNICGYEENKTILGSDGREYTGYFIIENSWGEKWGDDGYYYVPFEIADQVFFNTKISMMVDIDKTKDYARKMLEKLEDEIKNKKIKTESDIIRENINIEKAKIAFDAGLWNGKNPTATASREEVATMIVRAFELAGVWDFKQK